MRDEHEQQELRIFSAFTAVCPLEVDLKSIEKRHRPEPDIFCKTSEGPRAFELVELVDRDGVARPIGDQLELMDALRDACKALPDELSKSLADVWAEINIRSDISLRRRKAIARDLVGELVKKEKDFAGKFTLEEGNVEIAAAKVRRLDYIAGPHFYVPAGGALDPVPLDAVTVKFGKDYRSDAAIDLLAYYDRQHAPLEQQIAELVQFINANIVNSSFERFWIFNTYDKRIYYSPVAR